MNTIHTSTNGWERLSNGFDVEFRHSIPYRLSDNGMAQGETPPELLEEITSLGRLHVRVGDWHAGESPGEHEASLYVTGRELPEVLQRLARSAAAVFVNRYHKPVDHSDVDWDRLEYLKNFCAALDHCGLDTYFYAVYA